MKSGSLSLMGQHSPHAASMQPSCKTVSKQHASITMPRLIVPDSDTQIWSIVVGMPLCAVGGVFYSWASGQTLVEGFVNAYGALYKIPGAPSLWPSSDSVEHLHQYQ